MLKINKFHLQISYFTAPDASEMRKWLGTCQNRDGGFGANYQHDSHLISSHYTCLVMLQYNLLDEFFAEEIEVDLGVNDADTRIHVVKGGEGPTYATKGGEETDATAADIGEKTKTKIGVGKKERPSGKEDEDEDEKERSREKRAAFIGEKTKTKTKTTTRREALIEYVASMQLSDGSFRGDVWGECDMRFVYDAFSILTILDGLHTIKVERAVEWIVRCVNYDGGFGWLPGCESHAAACFVAVGALTLADNLHNAVSVDELGYFLCTRQTAMGGLNGRPEKAPDVCYSWWILSTLTMINRLHWIDPDKLCQWILLCQDKPPTKEVLMAAASASVIPAPASAIPAPASTDAITDEKGEKENVAGTDEKEKERAKEKEKEKVEQEKPEKKSGDKEEKESGDTGEGEVGEVGLLDDYGGLADRPGNTPDPFHTFFGIAGLSLLCHRFPDLREKYLDGYRLKEIDPVYALPRETLIRHKLPLFL